MNTFYWDYYLHHFYCIPTIIYNFNNWNILCHKTYYFVCFFGLSKHTNWNIIDETIHRDHVNKTPHNDQIIIKKIAWLIIWYTQFSNFYQ